MLGAILSLVKLIPLLLDLVKVLQEKFGPDWDKALVELGRGFALLPAAQTEAERKAALNAISRAINGGK